ncbi:MAG: HPr family phosphocarrier protein [Desulfobacula sp.]|jgi:phosphotransferase system HPr-like phosphotransfer protein|uniref:HPr family phosphocarrier protein n=1 Tax=Desulfobacula sp. TaxID=2593537 RepID=UPI001D46F23A|nr:HPr family phosphocarrier protein [Desulfobacula sp.]MBT3485431.1 HPr family phosphocarrier protein [Desulfobacula sp.]MBT3805574.1 HPr family phosphocarrier protein [Desulfobacula sp.]MBT4026070.1 HPr family phosphocarrier protein [Desulfobacula sp.]MBT4199982.1 HPr family phosphocarrier protein [Desulfobacula sp.]
MNFTCDISFKEKANIFSFEYLKCILFVHELDDDDYIFTKKIYSKLITSSHILEDFLDFHGAKKNKEWVFYRELSATIQHLSLACYSQRHILNRFKFYAFEDNKHNTFKLEAFDTLKILQQSIKLAAPVVLEEARRLKINIPTARYDLSYFPGISSVQQLDHNIDDFNSKDQQKENLTRISSEFLEVVKDFDQFAFYERYDLKKIYELVPGQINEVIVRRYEMLIHNIQSSFDSYVVNTKSSSENFKLEQLRSHFSIVFNMLQVTGRLLHFYERHLHDIGFKDVYKNVGVSLSEFIDPDVLLDRAVNFGLFYAWKFLSSGKALASKILNENMETAQIEVGIPKDRGFHSRPSLLVAKIVQHYGGEVKMHVNNDVFDAASVLDIQWAGGKIKKEEIEIVKFKGDLRALNDLKILAAVNYGEDHMGKGIPLPKELSYLS